MPQITCVEPRWLSTFPHVAAPLPDEWIAGLLLRCDEMNHRESGTTWRYLLRSTTHPGFGPGSPFIVVPESILESLIHLLMISTERLLATTYACELARLYAPARPHAEHLLGHRRGVTGVHGFRIALHERLNLNQIFRQHRVVNRIAVGNSPSECFRVVGLGRAHLTPRRAGSGSTAATRATGRRLG